MVHPALLRLQQNLSDRLLAFPATPFRPDLSLDLDRFSSLVERLTADGAGAIFPASGAGEFFSLSLREYEEIVCETVRVVGGRMPVIPGVGYGAGMAAEFARCAERAGADGILLLPPYLVQAEQEGLGHHVRSIASCVGVGVILYARDNATYSADLLEALTADCPNLIGLKDGVGDLEVLLAITRRLAGRLVIMGGLPTAELFALPYHALGITSYSSAVYNFIPSVAMRFFRALGTDPRIVLGLLDSFYLPLAKLCARRRGYAVSVIKAGLRVTGFNCGSVRPPLVDFTSEEEGALLRLVETNA